MPRLRLTNGWRAPSRASSSTAGPRFFGWVFGGVTPGAIAGDWLISALDQQGSLWTANPASVQTEHAAVRWLKEMFEIPADWVGTTTSGATMSNMVGLSAGRQWVGQQLGFDPALDGLAGNPVIPVVTSTEIHTSAIKALGHLGLGKRAIRKVAAPGGAIDLAAFERELESIDGPVLVVANAAEVNSGTFDDLNGMIDIARAHPGGAWVHVDGAFGLFARLSERTRHLVDGIERADSIGSDAHKWLNVPYDSGFAFVRDREALFGSFSNPAAYLAGASVGLDFDVYIPEMSRRARGVAIWMLDQADGPARLSGDGRPLPRQHLEVRILDRIRTRRRARRPRPAQHRLLALCPGRPRRGRHRPVQPRRRQSHPGRRPRLRLRHRLQRPRRHPLRLRQLDDDCG